MHKRAAAAFTSSSSSHLMHLRAACKPINWNASVGVTLSLHSSVYESLVLLSKETMRTVDCA